MEKSPVGSGADTGQRKLPGNLLEEILRAGMRRAYGKGMRRLPKALPSSVAARSRYDTVKIPVTQVWGDDDRSPLADRSGVERSIPAQKAITPEGTGHSSALECPQEWAGVTVSAVKG